MISNIIICNLMHIFNIIQTFRRLLTNSMTHKRETTLER